MSATYVTRQVSVILLHDPVVAASKTFAVALSGASVSPAAASTQVTVTEPPFGAWQFTNFGAVGTNDPAVSGPGADPDGDSMSNLLEYAFNRDPKVPGGGLPGPAVEVDPNDGQSHLTLVFECRLPPLDLIYHAEISTDLSTWSEDPALIQLDPPVSDGNGITESVKARGVAPIGAGPRQCLRVRVTQP